MKYMIIILGIFLFLLIGCESEQFVFRPCITYGDSYLTAMSQYVCMLESWQESQGQPPKPQPPPEMHAGSFPRMNFQNNPFMQGYSEGYASGAQTGAIMLQSARNQAYGIALHKYYSFIRKLGNKDISVKPTTEQNLRAQRPVLPL
jgi:hypothetical protein